MIRFAFHLVRAALAVLAMKAAYRCLAIAEAVEPGPWKVTPRR